MIAAANSPIATHPWVQRALVLAGSRWLRVAITAALIAFGLSQIPLGDVVHRLEHADGALVALGVALLLVGQILCGQRWHALAASLDIRESRGWFTAAYLRGCFYNSVLPTGIGGDAMRVALLKPAATWRRATRSVVLDRVSGLIALALAAGLGLPLAGLGLAPEITWAAATAGIVCAVGSALYARQQQLLGWLAWTVAYELIWFAGVWSLARALGVHMGWATPAVVLVVGLAMALPISFGGHGAREAGFVLALAPLGIAADRAVAVGVLFGCALALVGLAGALARVRPAAAAEADAADADAGVSESAGPHDPGLADACAYTSSLAASGDRR